MKHYGFYGATRTDDDDGYNDNDDDDMMMTTTTMRMIVVMKIFEFVLSPIPLHGLRFKPSITPTLEGE